MALKEYQKTYGIDTIFLSNMAFPTHNTLNGIHTMTGFGGFSVFAQSGVQAITPVPQT